MFPDRWGSDYDYLEAHGNFEEPELNEDQPLNLCEHGINLDNAGCGKCWEASRTDADEEAGCYRTRKLTRTECEQGLADQGYDRTDWEDC